LRLVTLFLQPDPLGRDEIPSIIVLHAPSTTYANRSLTFGAEFNSERSWRRALVDRVALQVGETLAEVQLMPGPARSLSRGPLGHEEGGC